MIVRKIFVQNTAAVLPSTFTTSTEFTSMLRMCNGPEFYVIPPEEFTPCMVVEKETGGIVVTATAIANTRQVYSSKVTTSKAVKIPPGYRVYFNLDGKVLDIKTKDSAGLYLDKIKAVAEELGLPVVEHSTFSDKMEFIGAMLTSVIDEDKKELWEGMFRTGFHIGDGCLRHTNKIAMFGIVAVAIPLDASVRIKGVFKHEPDYAETVFWFELHQCAPTIYEILKNEEIKSMEGLNKCL